MPNNNRPQCGKTITRAPEKKQQSNNNNHVQRCTYQQT